MGKGARVPRSASCQRRGSWCAQMLCEQNQVPELTLYKAVVTPSPRHLRRLAAITGSVIVTTTGPDPRRQRSPCLDFDNQQQWEMQNATRRAPLGIIR